MGAGVRPEFNPADRWEELVRGGMSEQQATATVQRELQTMNPNPPARPQSDPRSIAGAAQALRQERGPADITPSVSARMLGEAQAAQPNRPRPANEPSLLGTLAQAGQGAMFGFGDELYGGVRALAGEDYETARSRADQQLRRYADDNPASSFLANIAGGMATGTAMGVPRIPGTSGLGATGRALNTVATGAVTGGAGAAGAAAPGERIKAFGGGAAAGGALAGLFAGAAGLIKGTARAVGAGPKRAQPAMDGSAPQLMGRAQQALGMETAEDAGARRMLRVLERSGMTTDDLAQAASQADGPDLLGEVVGTRGVRALRTARSIGNRAPQQIEDVLDDRAMEEAARLRETFQRLTGAQVGDAKAVAREAMDRVQPTLAKLYQRVETVPLGDDDARRLADVVGALDADGNSVSRLVRRMGGTGAEDMAARLADDAARAASPVTLREALTMRQALDALVDDNAATSAGRQINRRLVEARGVVDDIVKRAGGDRVAQQYIQAADELYADAAAIGESFATGTRAFQSGNAATAARMVGEAKRPEAARLGVGSEVMRRLSGVVDEGGVQNPGPRVVGGETRREITRQAFPDDQTFAQFRAAADNTGRRLRNRYEIVGGSQTADKLADIAEFATDPQAYTDAASGRFGSIAQRVLSGGIGRRLMNQNAEEADAMTRYLLAGGADQMTREQAIAMLQQIEPFLQARLAAQTARRGSLAGATATAGFLRDR